MTISEGAAKGAGVAVFRIVSRKEWRMYEFIGTVKTVGEVQTFASGFQKRELVVEETGNGKWPNVVAFAFKKDNVAKLDGVRSGQRVKVSFAVDGREWTDPKTGKVRYFADLTALRLEVLDGAAVPPPAEPEDQLSFVAPEDEPPF